MDAATALDDPLGALLIWAALAFLLWLILSVLVRPLRTQSVLITASVSWIVARLFLWVLPTILHQMEVWFGT
jgi:hypothetical protein